MAGVFVSLRKYEVPTGIDIRRIQDPKDNNSYSWRKVGVVHAKWIGDFDDEAAAVKDATQFLRKEISLSEPKKSTIVEIETAMEYTGDRSVVLRPDGQVVVDPQVSDEQLELEIREPWDEPTERCAKELQVARMEARRLDTALAELIQERKSRMRNGLY